MKHSPFLRLAVILALLALLISAGAALASSGGSYELSWFDISDGSPPTAGGSYELRADVGQPDTGQASGGSYQLTGGFLVSGAFYQNTYLPLISK